MQTATCSTSLLSVAHSIWSRPGHRRDLCSLWAESCTLLPNVSSCSAPRGGQVLLLEPCFFLPKSRRASGAIVWLTATRHQAEQDGEYNFWRTMPKTGGLSCKISPEISGVPDTSLKRYGQLAWPGTAAVVSGYFASAPSLSTASSHESIRNSCGLTAFDRLPGYFLCWNPLLSLQTANGIYIRQIDTIGGHPFVAETGT